MLFLHHVGQHGDMLNLLRCTQRKWRIFDFFFGIYRACVYLTSTLLIGDSLESRLGVFIPPVGLGTNDVRHCPFFVYVQHYCSPVTSSTPLFSFTLRVCLRESLFFSQCFFIATIIISSSNMYEKISRCRFALVSRHVYGCAEHVIKFYAYSFWSDKFLKTVFLVLILIHYSEPSMSTLK